MKTNDHAVASYRVADGALELNWRGSRKECSGHMCQCMGIVSVPLNVSPHFLKMLF